MKNSKTIFVCAVMLIAAEIAKIIVSVGDIYTFYAGWVNSLVLDVTAVWVVCNSEVKRKGLLALCGVLLLLLVTAFVATLSALGFVVIG